MQTQQFQKLVHSISVLYFSLLVFFWFVFLATFTSIHSKKKSVYQESLFLNQNIFDKNTQHSTRVNSVLKFMKNFLGEIVILLVTTPTTLSPSLTWQISKRKLFFMHIFHEVCSFTLYIKNCEMELKLSWFVEYYLRKIVEKNDGSSIRKLHTYIQTFATKSTFKWFVNYANIVWKSRKLR